MFKNLSNGQPDRMTEPGMIRSSLGARYLASMLLGLLAWPVLSEESFTLDEIRGLTSRVLCQRLAIATNAVMALDLRDEINKRQVDCAMDFEAAVIDYTPEPKEPIPPPPTINVPAALTSITPKPQEVRIPEGVVRVSTAQRAGSGFFLDPLHVVTNAHVVESSPYVALAFSEGQPFSGRVIFTNPELDFAIIESRLQGTPIPIKRTPIIVGEHITTFGFPQGRTVYLAWKKRKDVRPKMGGRVIRDVVYPFCANELPDTGSNAERNRSRRKTASKGVRSYAHQVDIVRRRQVSYSKVLGCPTKYLGLI